MAHVTEIKIEGLLGRKRTIHIELKRDVNVFFGDNGGGKTTLLKIIASALSRESEIMDALPVERAEIFIESISDRKIIKHVWERTAPSVSPSSPDPWELQPSVTTAELERYARLKRSIRSVERPHSEWKMSSGGKKYESNFDRWSHTFLPTTRLYLGSTAARIGPSSGAISETQLDTLFAEAVNRAWLQYYSETLSKVRGDSRRGFEGGLE